MNKEIYEALKRLVFDDYEKWGGNARVMKETDKEKIKDWINQNKEENCEGCGKPLVEGESIAGNRHSTCI